MTNLGAFVGIPYLAGGRDREGLDCYGLVRLALLELFYVELPAMITGPVSPRCLWRALTTGTNELTSQGQLVPVSAERLPRGPLIAVSWHNGIAVHCGLRLGMNLLHTHEQAGASVIERVSHFRARSGPLECYQWQP